MTDLSSALHLSAPELTLAVGGLVLLMLGAFAGEKSTRLVSGLSVLLLLAATALAAVGPLGAAFNGAYVADRSARAHRAHSAGPDGRASDAPARLRPEPRPQPESLHG